MALTFEWDKDIYGRSVLIARKSRGKISIAELQEEMSRDYRYNGGWAIIVRAQEESYQGWGGGEEPKGDVVELYQLGEDESCPVCAAVYRGVDYCPHCGEKLREGEQWT